MSSNKVEGEEPFKSERPSTMFSIQVQEFGEPSVMKCLPAKVPVPGKGEVLVRLCGEIPQSGGFSALSIAGLPTNKRSKSMNAVCFEDLTASALMMRRPHVLHI
jgi:hypothetical protein